ncbi:hypothetical protein ACNOYE_16005 [Nannocystaceae bacterium ST9]
MAKSDEAETTEPSRLRWVLGWVGLPAAIVLVLFAAGVHVGARHPEMWLSRVMLWLFG